MEVVGAVLQHSWIVLTSASCPEFSDKDACQVRLDPWLTTSAQAYLPSEHKKDAFGNWNWNYVVDEIDRRLDYLNPNTVTYGPSVYDASMPHVRIEESEGGAVHDMDFSDGTTPGRPSRPEDAWHLPPLSD
jgi:hypothetical protein